MSKARKIFKRFYRLIIALLLLLFLFLVLLYFAIESPRFQTFISQKVTNTLSQKLGVDIKIKKVKVSFFDNIVLEEFFIEDLQKDTLIYFKKAEANFSYVSLLDNEINLENFQITDLNLNILRLKNDSLFNFNFLLPKNKQTQKKKNINKQKWEIVVQDINFLNSRFAYVDSLTGTLITTNIPRLNIEVSEFNMNENKFQIKKLFLDKPIINFTKSKNNKNNKKDFILDIPAFIYAQNILVNKANFNFKNTNDTLKYKKMAFNDLKVKDIDIHISNTYLWGDSISANIVNLNLIEDSGFEINKMNSLITINNRKINLDTLNIQTNKSTINTSIKLDYRNFQAFQNFSNEVRFKASLSNTIINPDDLKYFVETKKLGLGGVFKISGDISGKMSSLKARNIRLLAGNRTEFNGKFSLNGLPNIKETFISFKMDKLVTDYNDLKFINSKIPLPPNARQLGTIFFKGRFDGFYSDFVTYGEANTALGTVNTDINFKMNKSGVPSYSGNVNVLDFEIGKWFGKEEQVGAISLNTIIKGKGLKLDNLDVELKGDIQKLTLKHYTYSNIEVDGSFKDKFFQGKAIFDDKHLKMNFEGLVDATGKAPVFDFQAKLDKIDLKPLNLSKKDFVLSGELKSNFKANSIDDILGNLEMNNLKIDLDNKIYEFKNVSLNSTSHDGEKHLDIKGDNFDILVHGEYSLLKIPRAIKHLLVSNDTIDFVKQQLRFDAEITDKTDLISLFIPNLKIPKKILISGNLDTETQSILTYVSIPELQFGKTKFKNFISNINVENGKIDMINSLPEILLNDSILVKDISLFANGYKDNINFKLNASNKNENTALGIKGGFAYARKLFTINLDTNSTILINNSFWHIARNNSISFNKNVLLAKNFNVSNGISEANFKVNRRKGKNNLIVNLKNIQVEDFAEILRNKGLDLKGAITGEVKVDNFDVEPAINGNLDFLGISLNNYLIGNFKLNSRVDIPDKKVYFTGGLFSKENHININGAYSFSKTSTKDDIDIDVFIKQLTIKSFEDLIPKFITKSAGTLNGNLKIYGARKTPNINGLVEVNDVTTTVAYTNVKYTIAETKVKFIDNEIVLEDNFMVQDDEGNKAFGSGKILHKNLKNWALDLKIVTDNVKALNTTIKENDVFYGTAYINGGARFKGLTTEPVIYIWGNSEPGSFIDVPLTDDIQVKNHEFYQFVSKQNTEEGEDDKAIKIRGAKVQLDLDLDEDLELKLILDHEAGDVLKVNGVGDIKIDVGQHAEYVNFYGDYLISKGDYLFTMQKVVNKPFKITEGSSINFNGNIYKEATIDMMATYSKKIAVNDFIAEYIPESDAELMNIARKRVPVTLFLDLKDKLSKPTISFDIEIDNVDPKIRNYVENKLQAIKLNESEMNNQIFGVLVLTRFLPSYSTISSTSTSSVADATLNTVTELISSQLSRYLTDWASYVVDDLEFMVNFSTYDVSDIAFKKRRELQLALTKRFFDDRLSINVGGDFDFGESYGQNNNSTATFFGANVSFEYTLTKNRRWRVKAFYLSDYDSYDINNARKNRSGVGLSYKREFDDIYDLFNIKKPAKN